LSPALSLIGTICFNNPVIKKFFDPAFINVE